MRWTAHDCADEPVRMLITEVNGIQGNPEAMLEAVVIFLRELLKLLKSGLETLIPVGFMPKLLATVAVVQGAL